MNADPTPFSDADQQTLARIARLVIPPSEAYGVPGADDAVIFTEILHSAASRREEVVAAIASFLRCDDDPDRFRTECADAAEVLQTVVAQCYYRDDRVMRSLGMEPRPPFPKGYDAPETDWSLLDPVRARAPFYRAIEPE